MVSLYRFGDGALVSLLAAEAGSFAVTWPQPAAVNGRPTVFWQTGPFAYAVSGDIPEAELLAHRPPGGARSVATIQSTFSNRGNTPWLSHSTRPYAPARWASQVEFDEGLRKHMLPVYNYMVLGLALTGIVAFVVGTTPALYLPIFGTPLKWVVMLAPLAFVFFFSFRIQTMSTSTAQLTFWAFCAVMGLSMASIFLVFTGASIARVFFITAGMFGAASLYGYTTKADLTRWARSCSWA